VSGKQHFADALHDRMEEVESQVVVGLDPRIDRLPQSLVDDVVDRHGHSPRAAAEAISEFNRRVLAAVHENVVAVKCQVAFYEKWGVEGLKAYARTVRRAWDRDMLVIGDVKRNDIGSTAGAYAQAHLGGRNEGMWRQARDFVVDAATVNPYFGTDGMEPFLERASKRKKGLFALVRTSNPSSSELQGIRADDGEQVFRKVARMVEQWGEPYRGESGYSLLGAVVGATQPDALESLREQMPHSLFLVPGFGAQGGGVEDVVPAFDENGGGAVVNSSRGIIFAWQTPPYRNRYGPDRWMQAVEAAAAHMQTELWEATH